MGVTEGLSDTVMFKQITVNLKCIEVLKEQVGGRNVESRETCLDKETEVFLTVLR